MQQTLITILRDCNTTIDVYRQAANQLGTLLALESSSRVPKINIEVKTPLSLTHGVKFKKELILVPILRSGLVLLYPFLHFYPHADVGFIGTRRDETTAIAELYYVKLPRFEKDQPIFLLDPMIATGGSACMAVKVLKDAGAVESQITFIALIAAPEGISHLQKECPGVGLIIAQIDEGLDAHKRIVPGLGDFGDRYFGTEKM